VEFRFPSSGLTKLHYTSQFPPPPALVFTQDLYRTYLPAPQIQSVTIQPDRVQTEFEKGWYYYLADIAARRILQRVIMSFYTDGNSEWCDWSESYISSLVQMAKELDRQLTEW
jgi:hypothetical protein